MARKILLVSFTLVCWLYCFRFGYIWTAYGHGGQMAGIPFAIISLITTIRYFFVSADKSKFRTFLFGLSYFFMLAGFSITIETIRNVRSNYFEYLYYEPGGVVNKIFLSWILMGTVIYILLGRFKDK